MKILYFLLCCLMWLSACRNELPDDAARRILPVHISVKLDEGQTTRIPGDPGTAEQFRLPTMAYVYVLCYDRPSEQGHLTVVMPNGNKELTTGLPLLSTDWKEDSQQKGLYHYQGKIEVGLPLDARSARVYVAAAPHPISLDIRPQDVPSATYTVATQEFMRNLYSTPYNNKDASGQYYGTVRDMHTKVPHVDVVLYHVAARLDVKWNVAEAVRTDNALTYLEVIDLPQQGYLFRPTENALPAGQAPKTSIKILDLKTPAEGIGTAWSGRKVVYVPQTFVSEAGVRKYPFRVRLGANGEPIGPQGKPGEIVHYNELLPQETVFTSWIAVNLNINRKINNGIVQ